MLNSKDAIKEYIANPEKSRIAEYLRNNPDVAGKLEKLPALQKIIFLALNVVPRLWMDHKCSGGRPLKLQTPNYLDGVKDEKEEWIIRFRIACESGWVVDWKHG